MGDHQYLPVLDGIQKRRYTPPIDHIRIALAHGKQKILDHFTVALTGTQVQS